jgi:hypothetical protein
MYQPFVGDGTVSARVVTLTNTAAQARAGLMIRASTDPGAPFYAAYVTPSNSIEVQYRVLQGEFTRNLTTAGGAAPQYLQISRSGSVYETATSTDGVSWAPVPGSDTSLIQAGSSALGGLVASSQAAGMLGSAQFDSVKVQSAAVICTSSVSTGATLSAGYCSAAPGTWIIGQSRTYTVTVTNTGTQTWNAGGTNPVRLGLHFAASGAVTGGSGWLTDQRWVLPADVPPGGSATLSVRVTPPNTSGSYVLQAEMVKENVAWFQQVQNTNVTVFSLAASYSSAPPTAWSRGQTQTYTVTVTNTGAQTWNASGANPVHLGLHFSTSGAVTTGSGWLTDQRWSLPNDVPPGGSATITVGVTAPSTAGSYVLQEQMVKEQVAWFQQAQNTNVTVS